MTRDMAAGLSSVWFGSVRLPVNTVLHILSKGPSQELFFILLGLFFFTCPWCRAGAVVIIIVDRLMSLGSLGRKLSALMQESRVQPLGKHVSSPRQAVGKRGHSVGKLHF
jgi:hypothetical protein